MLSNLQSITIMTFLTRECCSLCKPCSFDQAKETRQTKTEKSSMNTQEIRLCVQEPLSRSAFPPQPSLPEVNCSDDARSLLFTLPVIVWVPECLNEGKRPRCAIQDSMYIPSVKQYKMRVIEGVEYKVRLLYVKYVCSGDSRYSFSTIGSSYRHAQVETVAHSRSTSEEDWLLEAFAEHGAPRYHVAKRVVQHDHKYRACASKPILCAPVRAQRLSSPIIEPDLCLFRSSSLKCGPVLW